MVGRNFFIQIYKQKITLDVLSFEQVQEFTKSFFYFVSIKSNFSGCPRFGIPITGTKTPEKPLLKMNFYSFIGNI